MPLRTNTYDFDLITFTMSAELKNKLNANAKHFRYLSRAETFHRNRKNVE